MGSGRGEVSRGKVKKQRSIRSAVRKGWGHKGMKSGIRGPGRVRSGSSRFKKGYVQGGVGSWRGKVRKGRGQEGVGPGRDRVRKG